MISVIAATLLVVFASYVECGSLPSEQIISSASVDVSSNAAPVSVESRQKSCWELIVDGRRLHPQFIVRSVWAATLLDCQRECEDVLFNCETIAFGQSPVKNTTCDLSDWEAASLSVQPYSTDTILAPTYNVYSRYGRYPNEPHDESRCNRFSSAHDSTSYRPVPTKLVGGATTFSEDEGTDEIINRVATLIQG